MIKRNLAVGNLPFSQHLCREVLTALVIYLVSQVGDLYPEPLSNARTAVTSLGQHGFGSEPDKMAGELICRRIRL